MTITDRTVFELIKRAKDHFDNNVNNPFVTRALATMQVPHMTWENIENLGSSQYYQSQGYPLPELYEQILSAAYFIHHARKEVLPNIRSLITGTSRANEDRTLSGMAANNLSPNLAIFADLINELYVKVTVLDREGRPENPLYSTMNELKRIGELLVEP